MNIMIAVVKTFKQFRLAGLWLIDVPNTPLFACMAWIGAAIRTWYGLNNNLHILIFLFDWICVYYQRQGDTLGHDNAP